MKKFVSLLLTLAMLLMLAACSPAANDEQMNQENHTADANTSSPETTEKVFRSADSWL